MGDLIDIRTSVKHAKNVVILDDQNVCCSINSAVVKSINRNIKINEFIEAKDALAYIKKHKVDLVITDYLMNEMSGLDFIDQVKALPNKNHISFIIVTVCNEDKIHQEFKKRGANKVFVKPPILEQFKDTCISLLYEPTLKFH